MARTQQRLFDAAPAAWELDAAEQRTIATVVLPTGPAGPFDYVAPDEFCDAGRPDTFVEPGRRVRIPFGRGDRSVVGYCVDVVTKAVAGRRLKSVAGVVDAQRLFSPAMLRLTRWMADYYLCPWGQVLEAVVPAGVRGKAGTRQVKLLSLAPTTADADAQKLRSPQQRKALEVLSESKRPLTASELAKRAGCTSAPIRALIKLGYVLEATARVPSDSLPLEGRAGEGVGRERKLELNEDQRAALNSIITALDCREARGIVLHGVTGSGKTEVYLQAIERVASFGRQAIVLVPEISLTPQTVRRFKARFDRVAVLHSHLSDVERHEHWRRIAGGEVQVVVGARSAIFAPTPHLGLVVIDEEHETTFKQDQAPRYHARDVAWRRVAAEGVPLVLGSATPSLESWQRTVTGEFERISLPRRVMNLPMPDVATIDLRDPAQTMLWLGEMCVLL
jgi:primosomal protein N' (replication factor Y)